MTQTTNDDYDDMMMPMSPLHKLRDIAAADQLDNLDILSLCEGTTDEYDITEDDYLSDDRKLDKSIDTASSCTTKSSSAERDDDSDVVILRNQTNSKRASSACSLPQESSIRLHATSTASYPIHYSDKSLHGVKSECSSSSSSAGSATISNTSRSQLPPRSRPFVLHLHNEPFHNAMELPSPSSASLHSGHGHITIHMQELTTKSNSAPILLKKERKRADDFVNHPIVSISTK